MSDPRDIVPFLYEAGHLKRSARQGWWIAGVQNPESVAEHSFRTAIVGYVIAVMEGADPERTATLCLFHDLPETRLGDVPSTGKRYISQAAAEQVAKDQTAALPGHLADRICGLVAEFEEKTTPEARCAKDADKLECLLQAREYQAQGNQQAQPWIDTMLEAVSTEAGRKLAAAAVEVAPEAWWHDIVSSYGRK
ncbi:HD domain-containing protein [Nonomuraea turkmeniaca]|uniref:5'-deoxynucleotidase n=1 Tax=Nonomuraea turkmeniaca TaxID=103838 RepID=A0A5S4FGD0_9ACTN|nr:HD domain-containing protein [Nonomuraea turkmeniaca]TMR18545.1 HD domain-containing protein [Nonomuraea turkmeniaca]